MNSISRKKEREILESIDMLTAPAIEQMTGGSIKKQRVFDLRNGRVRIREDEVQIFKELRKAMDIAEKRIKHLL